MKSIFQKLATITAVCILWSIGTSAAAPIKDVLRACDKSSTCGYSIDKQGDISGCDTNANGGKGQCFYCANDGKRECIAVRKVPGGKLKAVGGDVLNGLKAVQQ